MRNQNYRAFREDLRLPLITVELAFDEPFALTAEDTDILIQIRGGDRLWQKERLLNLALEALPGDCDQVMWIDADILVCNLPEWVDQIQLGLERHSVVQAFSTVNMLDADGKTILRNPSTVAAMQSYADPDQLFRDTLDRSKGAPCSGHVWAAHRVVLDGVGFYDGCIVGGGDSAFLCAATGDFDKVIQMHQMGAAQRERYLSWAEKIHRRVTDGVGFIDCQIDHLWHGSIENRRGADRHRGLSQIGFDPFSDIRLNQDKVWEWATDRPELHNYVRNYFLARQEDEAVAVGR